MRVVPSAIPEVLFIEPHVHRDERGFFVETYRHDIFTASGIPDVFVQDNHTRSVARTLRGLHLQVTRPQAKLVRVLSGEIYDVAVDVRRGSPTFGRWVGVTLSGDNFRQCYVPAGFAHGFCVVSAIADVAYKCTDVYDPKSEIGIAYDDPAIGVAWPVSEPILSARDRQNPRIGEIESRLPRAQFRDPSPGR